MTLSQRIELLAELGLFLKNSTDEALETAIRQSYVENRWFTPENTRQAIEAIATRWLDAGKLRNWVDAYPIGQHEHPEKTVGLVMAGNIPLVGFHDWLCVFMSGQRALVKLSDKDKRLLPFLIKQMGDWAFESWEYTEFVPDTDQLRGFDAVIATGSNNSARYFEQYFAKYPHLIRRNRNGVAVIDGSETAADLHALGRDIFTYFGLGCRNVSKIYVPHGYNFDILLEALHEYRDIIHHDKYKNNFDYNLTLFILNNMPYRNNGCILLREDPAMHARIASAHYEYYGDREEVADIIRERKEEIQCVVAKSSLPGVDTLPFGQTQQPGLSDYADGVDVMAFLTAL
ncbi:MAG: acyl-CoA reductase [Saprospiraceae bacterium]|nr:acyl-CoA reductase [Saprospiraceae bacterium]